MTNPQSPLRDADSEAEIDKRKLPRLAVSSELFRHEESGKVFSVVDLSLGGMAIRVLDTLQMDYFPVGGLASGWLNLRGERLRVKGRVTHLRPGVVGLEFQAWEDSDRERLEHFLDPEVLGRALKRMPAGASGRVRWYHSPGGVELFVERDDSVTTAFTLCLLRRVLVWTKERGLRSGEVLADGLSPGQISETVLEMETVEIRYDRVLDREYLKIAKRFVLSSSVLDAEIRTDLLEVLEHA